MPSVSVNPYVSIFPPKVGIVVHIKLSSIEAQTIKKAPALAEVLAVLAGLSYGPLAASLVAGFVYAARKEIGKKDKGKGVDFALDVRTAPLPSTTVHVKSR